MKHLSLLVIFVLSVLLAAGNTSAQSPAGYPTRPIRMILPYAPGGSSEFLGRILQPKLSEELGKQVVVENRPGADGNIGVEVAARAAPDGYTILLGNSHAMAVNPTIYPEFPIKPLRDLIGITAVVDIPGGVAVHSSIPANTIAEFIAYAKARPGQLSYGSAGVSSVQRLAFEFFMAKAGIKVLHVPYKGGTGAATIALLGGEVQASPGTISSFLPHLKSGRIKVIGVFAEKRLASLPHVSTFAEAGYPELTSGSWLGIYAPIGTPRPIVDRLHAALIKVLNDPWVLDRLAQGEAVPLTSKSPEEFAVFMKSQTEFWANIVKQLGVTEKW